MHASATKIVDNTPVTLCVRDSPWLYAEAEELGLRDPPQRLVPISRFTC